MPAVRAAPIKRRVTVVFMRSSLMTSVFSSFRVRARGPIRGPRDLSGDRPKQHARPPDGSAQLAIGLIIAPPVAISFDEMTLLANTSAPLPVIGAQGAYRFLPRWTLRGRAQLFRLAAGDYEGAINHVAIAFEHATFEH